MVRGFSWLALGLYVLATLILTWPLALPSEDALALHGDYFSNVWNLWWVRQCLAGEGSPFWTDALHHPAGASLARHTLSLVNAVPGALLADVIGLHGAYKLLLLVHFALSGWTCFLFVRELVGSPWGAFVAGLAWTFFPYHWYYAPQINLASLEGLPLAGLFVVRSVRRGGWRNGLGMILAAAYLALSSWYYLAYAGLLGLTLLCGWKSWSRGVPFVTGLRRLAPWTAVAAVTVLALAWPLLSESLGGPAPDAAARDEALQHALSRSNDLCGFLWVGPPERPWIAWPAFLGYAGLAMLVLGWRSLRANAFWVLVALGFLVLSLGPRLVIGGDDTGIGLPYDWIREWPLVSLLRKPDRFAMLTQLAFVVLMAGAWKQWSLGVSTRTRRVVGGSWALAVLVEFAPLPLPSFADPVNPGLRDVAVLPGAVLVEIPHHSGAYRDALATLRQTAHKKSLPHGYLTSHAIPPGQAAERKEWLKASHRLGRGDAAPLLAQLEDQEVQLVLWNKREHPFRKAGRPGVGVQWAPFAFLSSALLGPRFRGHLSPASVAREGAALERVTLEAVFGAPLYEDRELCVYRFDPR